MHFDSDVRGLRDDARPFLLADPRHGVQLVRLDAEDVVSVAEVPGGRRHSEVVAGGQLHIGDGETLLPGSLVVQVMTDRQSVLLIPEGINNSSMSLLITDSSPDGDPGLVLQVPELDLAPPDAGEAAVLVVVVGQ